MNTISIIGLPRKWWFQIPISKIPIICKTLAISSGFLYIWKTQKSVEQSIFKLIARINKTLLPSFTKQRLDLAKASKFQLAIIGWRYFITIKALGEWCSYEFSDIWLPSLGTLTGQSKIPEYELGDFLR